MKHFITTQTDSMNWTSINDYLPAFETEVYVWIGDRATIGKLQRVEETKGGKRVFWDAATFGYEPDETTSVTHWAKIEPPKAVKL